MLGLTQREVAAQFGVSVETVVHWETSKTQPPIDSVARILGFLAYDPFPESRSIGERLLAKRRAMGWSIRAAAREVGVDPGTWGDWERGKVILYRSHRALVACLLRLQEAEVDREMTHSWIQAHLGQTEPPCKLA